MGLVADYWCMTGYWTSNCSKQGNGEHVNTGGVSVVMMIMECEKMN